MIKTKFKVTATYDGLPVSPVPCFDILESFVTLCAMYYTAKRKGVPFLGQIEFPLSGKVLITVSFSDDSETIFNNLLDMLESMEEIKVHDLSD